MIEALFGRRQAVIGVIHLLPLPGSPHYDGDPVERIHDHAVAEAHHYCDGCVDGLIVENHGDIPFAKPEELGPETATMMAVITDRVRQAVDEPVGINVLANDVHVKHGAHAIVADRSLPELTRDAEFFDADAVIATGQRTGDSANLDDLATVRRSTGLAVLVGSGITRENVGTALAHADALIVASSLKHGGSWWNEVDPERVADFMNLVRTTRL